jgi:transposase InsO family protein
VARSDGGRVRSCAQHTPACSRWSTGTAPGRARWLAVTGIESSAGHQPRPLRAWASPVRPPKVAGPLPRPRPGWPGRPQLPTPPVPPCPAGQPNPPGPDRSAPPPPRPPSAGLAAAHAPLDRLRGAAPPPHEPARPYRPHQRRGGLLPAGTTRRAGPPRRQEAGPHPRGGGHRAHGRAAASSGRGIGYDHVHSAVDDRSRVAFGQLLPHETATTAALFLVEAASFFADHGVRIEQVLTDNAKAYAESVAFAETAAGLGIRLKRTRRFRPQTNGKVERFNKTLLDEWAYARPYRSTTERRRAFRRWAAVLKSPPTTHLARRPHADGGPRQQRWWEPQLAQRSGAGIRDYLK